MHVIKKIEHLLLLCILYDNYYMYFFLPHQNRYLKYFHVAYSFLQLCNSHINLFQTFDQLIHLQS